MEDCENLLQTTRSKVDPKIRNIKELIKEVKNN